MSFDVRPTTLYTYIRITQMKTCLHILTSMLGVCVYRPLLPMCFRLMTHSIRNSLPYRYFVHTEPKVYFTAFECFNFCTCIFKPNMSNICILEFVISNFVCSSFTCCVRCGVDGWVGPALGTVSDICFTRVTHNIIYSYGNQM